MNDINMSVSNSIDATIAKYGIGELNEIRRIVRDVMHKVEADSCDEDLADVAQERHLQLVNKNPDASVELLNNALKALCAAVVEGQQRRRVYGLVKDIVKRNPVDIVSAEAPSAKAYKSRSQRRRELVDDLRGQIATLEAKIVSVNRIEGERDHAITKMEILKHRAANVSERFKMHLNGGLSAHVATWNGLTNSIKLLDHILDTEFRPQSSLCTEASLPSNTLNAKTIKCTIELPLLLRSVTPDMIGRAEFINTDDHCTLWMKIPGYQAVEVGRSPRAMSHEDARSWKARMALIFNGAGKISETLVFQERRSVAYLFGLRRHKVFTISHKYTNFTANAIIRRILKNNQ